MSPRFVSSCLVSAGLLLAGSFHQAGAQSFDPPKPKQTKARHAKSKEDVEVAVEVRFITVDESCPWRLGLAIERKIGEGGLERVGVDFNNLQQNASPGQIRQSATANRDRQHLTTAFVTDLQAFALMEAVQGDPRSSIMQAPKLTLLDGQNSVIRIQPSFVTNVDVVELNGQRAFVPKNDSVGTGLQLAVHPVISADHRYVRLDLAGKLTWPDAATVEAFLKETVSLPDGGTVLLSGLKKVSESRNEFGPPVLSKIPYISRLFKNTGNGRETEDVLVMVTARIMVPKEMEARQAKKVAKLVKEYQQACAAGRLEEARKLAGKALHLNPACFSTQYAIDPNQRITELLNQSEDLRAIERIWFIDQPSYLTPERVDGGNR